MFSLQVMHDWQVAQHFNTEFCNRIISFFSRFSRDFVKRRDHVPECNRTANFLSISFSTSMPFRFRAQTKLWERFLYRDCLSLTNDTINWLLQKSVILTFVNYLR